MYADRLQYPEEHEVEGTGAELPKSDKTTLVFLKDTLTQFNLMNIKEDYGRTTEDDECLKYQQIRLEILDNRIVYVQDKLKASQEGQVNDVLQNIKRLLSNVHELETLMAKKVLPTAESINTSFMDISNDINHVMAILNIITPKHRPIHIQTTDAGPGVGTSEETRIRMTEQFLINDLDLQSRFHYAPRDSKAHKVEQVMSSLNEACGDGRFIDVQRPSLVNTVGEKNLLKMTVRQVDEMKTRNEQDIGRQCPETVAGRYTGARCMGTTIHAKTLTELSYLHFFFDEHYMKQIHDTKSIKKREMCPNNGYFNFLKGKQKEIYIQYQNGVEGIRHKGKFRCPHKVERVPPPVLNYQDNIKDKLHYYAYDDVPDSDKGNIYNPMIKLTEFVNACGEPKIDSRLEEDTLSIYDANHTWQKLLDCTDDLVKEYCGEDPRKVAVKEIEKKYLQKLRKSTKSLEAKHIHIKEPQLTCIQTGELKIKIAKSKLHQHQALP